MKTAGKIFIVCYRTASFALVAAAVIMVGLYIFGIRPYAVKTGSMEPAIPEGSLCFINHNIPYEELHKGQVIAFKTRGMLVTHRIVRFEEEGIVTKGDANNTEDTERVKKENYIGKNQAVLPYIGRFPLFVMSGTGRPAVVLAFAAFLLTGLLYDRISERIYEK